MVLPIMALVATWLYVMIFLATSLLFSHYLMPALKQLREFNTAQAAAQASAIQSEQAKLDALAIDTTAKELNPLELPAPNSVNPNAANPQQ